MATGNSPACILRGRGRPDANGLPASARSNVDRHAPGMVLPVPNETGFDCRGCGQRHDSLPFSYDAPAPAGWTDEVAADPHSVLNGEQCVIRGEQYFVRARLLIPVTDADAPFEWGVWVSVGEETFRRMSEQWSSPGREYEPPYVGWLATELPLYHPPTLRLRCNVHTQPVGVRPTVELEPTDHPLAVEQWTGITVARVRQIAAELLHR